MKKLLLLLIWTFPALAQNEFTHYVPNASAIGQGGSALTDTDSPALIFWNPGALAFAVNDKIMINACEPSSFNYIGFTKFFPPRYSVGMSHIRIVQDDILLDVATIALSKRITQFFSIGGNVNYGKYNITDKSFLTSSFGIMLKPAINRRSFYQAGNTLLDFLYNPKLYERFAFGLMVHNVPLDDSSVLHQLRIGTSLRISQIGPLVNFGYHLHKGNNATHLGVGFYILRNIFFHVGLKNFDVNYLSLGSGISIGMVTTNVSYSPDTEKLSFSLSIRLNDDAKILAKRYVDQGTRLIKENEFRKGLVEYEKSLSFNQNNERIIFLTNVLEKKIDAENQKIDSLFAQAEQFRNKSWYINAIVAYKKIIEIDRNNKKAWHKINELKPELNRYINWLYQIGENSFQSDKLDRARIVFKEIVQLRNNHRGALKYLAKIDSVTSYLSNEYYYRGLGYYKQRHLERSKEAFEYVLELNPNHNEARYYVNKITQENSVNAQFIERTLEEAHQLQKSGEYQLAIQKYQKILDINKDNENAAKQLELLQAYERSIVNRKIRRAQSLFDRGDYDEAKTAFEEILSIKYDHTTAKNYLNKINNIESDLIENHLQLATQYFENKQWDEASRECEKILLINPEHPDARKMQTTIWTYISIEELQQRGLELFKNGEYHLAIKAFKQIREKDPNNELALSYIAECQAKISKRIAELFNNGMRYYTRGDYESAIRDWEKVLILDPHYESAIEYKIKAEERLEALKNLP